MKKLKPALVLLIKVFVSVGLLVFVFTRIHIERFFDTFAAAEFRYIALALLVYLGSQFLSALRWKILARPLGFNGPFKFFLNFYLIGMFFNLFAPGTVGGDVTRIYYLAREGESNRDKAWGGATMHAAVSVFIDRLVGMVVLVWLGALGLALFPEYAVPSAVRWLTFALAGGFVTGGMLVPVLRRILPAGGHPMVVKFRVALGTYRAHWHAIPQAIGLSFVVHVIQAWIHLVIGRAIHIEIPFSYCIILYPLVGTFAALPISLNGLGLREGGYLFLLAVVGINSEKSIAFGVLLFLTVAVDSMIGGVVYLLKKSPAPSAVVVENKT
jgi:uncharacterized membrane protein YbhN (UPF0104 family)